MRLRRRYHGHERGSCEDEVKTKRMAAATFNSKCMAVIDEVQTKRITVVITKRGKPIVRLEPMELKQDDIFGFLKGKGKVSSKSDIAKPALTLREWGNLA